MKYLTVLFLFSRGSSLPSSFLDRNHGLLQEQTYCGQNLEKILLLARIYNWSESLVFYYSASSHHCSASDWYVFVYLLMWHFVIVFISTFNVRLFFSSLLLWQAIYMDATSSVFSSQTLTFLTRNIDCRVLQVYERNPDRKANDFEPNAMCNNDS